MRAPPGQRGCGGDCAVAGEVARIAGLEWRAMRCGSRRAQRDSNGCGRSSHTMQRSPAIAIAATASHAEPPMGRLTTHVLDTAQRPPGRRHRASRCYRNLGERYALVTRRASPMPTAAATRRCSKARRSPPGRYRLVFAAGEYFAAQRRRAARSAVRRRGGARLRRRRRGRALSRAAARVAVELLHLPRATLSRWKPTPATGCSSLIRWVHLITGIAWIGASFYFVFLDNSLLPPKRQGGRRRGRRRRAVGDPRRRLLSRAEVPRGAGDAARAAALVQVGGVLDVDVRLRAVRRHVLRARRAST